MIWPWTNAVHSKPAYTIAADTCVFAPPYEHISHCSGSCRSACRDRANISLLFCGFPQKQQNTGTLLKKKWQSYPKDWTPELTSKLKLFITSIYALWLLSKRVNHLYHSIQIARINLKLSFSFLLCGTSGYTQSHAIVCKIQNNHQA